MSDTSATATRAHGKALLPLMTQAACVVQGAGSVHRANSEEPTRTREPDGVLRHPPLRDGQCRLTRQQKPASSRRGWTPIRRCNHRPSKRRQRQATKVTRVGFEVLPARA